MEYTFLCKILFGGHKKVFIKGYVDLFFILISGPFHFNEVRHSRQVACANLYLKHCSKSSLNPTSLEETYLKAFFYQASQH